jgi:hypothetical protein
MIWQVLYLTLEKRYNFSLDELEVVANGYRHFRSFFAVQDGNILVRCSVTARLLLQASLSNLRVVQCYCLQDVEAWITLWWKQVLSGSG